MSFVFLWQFAKVLSVEINPELVSDTATSCWDVPCGHPDDGFLCYSFQCADSKAVNPLLTAIAVSTIMVANKEMNR